MVPSIYPVLSPQAWSSVTDNMYHGVPGLTTSVWLNNASPVSISWNLTLQLGYGILVTRLSIDGVAVPGSQHIVGQVYYGSSAGTSFATLAAGTHQISLEYRTNANMTFDPTVEWATASLQVMAFDQ